jgi:hypothetical protein
MKERERESLRRRKKKPGAVKSGSAQVTLAVQYKPSASPLVLSVASFTAVMGSELSLRFPREESSLTKREREGRLT